MMKSSPWIKPVQKKANDLETKIIAVSDALTEILKC